MTIHDRPENIGDTPMQRGDTAQTPPKQPGVASREHIADTRHTGMTSDEYAPSLRPGYYAEKYRNRETPDAPLDTRVRACEDVLGEIDRCSKLFKEGQRQLVEANAHRRMVLDPHTGSRVVPDSQKVFEGDSLVLRSGVDAQVFAGRVEKMAANVTNLWLKQLKFLSDQSTVVGKKIDGCLTAQPLRPHEESALWAIVRDLKDDTRRKAHLMGLGDKRAVFAVLNAPRAITGLSEQAHTELKDISVKKFHPELIAERDMLDELHKAIGESYMKFDADTKAMLKKYRSNPSVKALNWFEQNLK